MSTGDLSKYTGAVVVMIASIYLAERSKIIRQAIAIAT
jgi:hypothetical protein